MFSLNHFLWLLICICLIVLLLYVFKIKKISFNHVLIILVITCFISEFVKNSVNMIAIDETNITKGFILDPNDLPFHLCSIQMFFFIALKFFVKNEKTKDTLLGFMIPTLLIGGIMAIFIPTVGTSFKNVQVYQYFLYHMMIIFFAIYCLENKIVDYKWTHLKQNLIIMVFLAFFALWINSMLSGVIESPNFFYITRPPMENLPLLNLNNGWYAYFLTLVTLVILLFTSFNAIVMLIYKKRR